MPAGPRANAYACTCQRGLALRALVLCFLTSSLCILSSAQHGAAWHFAGAAAADVHLDHGPWVRGPEAPLPDDLRVDGLAQALDDVLELAAMAGAHREVERALGGPMRRPLVYLFSVHQTMEYSDRAEMWRKLLTNALVSMERAGVSAPALVLSTNEAVCDVAAEAGVPCFLDRPSAGRGYLWLTQLDLKLRYLLNAAALGTDVVVVDADVVFVRDPTPLFARRAFSSEMQTEAFLGTKRIPGQPFEEVNAGFVYARSDPDTVRFLLEAARKRWVHCTVQCALNRFMRELSPEIDEPARVLRFPGHNVSVHLLDTLHFPAGMEYFWVRAPQSAGVVPYIVHANWAVREEKVHVLRDQLLWFVDPPEYWNGRFLTYKPPGGGATLANQVDALVRAATVARLANRTLVLPRVPCGMMGPALHARIAAGTDLCGLYFFMQVQLLGDALDFREAAFFERLAPARHLTFARMELGVQDEQSIRGLLARTEGYDVVELSAAEKRFFFRSYSEMERVMGLLPAGVSCCPTLTRALPALGLAWPFGDGCRELASLPAPADDTPCPGQQPQGPAIASGL
eukprot:tig00021314_g20126.t1